MYCILERYRRNVYNVCALLIYTYTHAHLETIELYTPTFLPKNGCNSLNY